MPARFAALVALSCALSLGCRPATGDGGPSESVAGPAADAALEAWVDAVGDRALLTVVIHPREASGLVAAVAARLALVIGDDAKPLLDPLAALEAEVGPLPGWDRARPIVAGVFEPAIVAPPGAHTPQLPDPLDRAAARMPVRHRVLVPVSDGAALKAAVEAALGGHGWSRAGETWSRPGLHAQLAVEPDRLRVELASGDRPPSAWTTPGGPSARTPAHATLVATDGAPVRVLVRPWLLRAVFTEHGAQQIAEALATVTGDMAPALASHGAALLMLGETLMHGEGAEFDDWALTAAGGPEGLDVRVVATLTAVGRAVLDRRGRVRPLAPGAGAVAHGALAADVRAMLDGATTPAGLPVGDGPSRLASAFAECGVGCPLHALLRRPFGLAKVAAAQAAGQVPVAAGELRAPQVVFFGMQGPAPRAAVAWQVPAGADLGPVQAMVAEARAPGLELWTRPLDDGGQAVIVGIGVTADAFGAPVDGAPLAAMAVDPSAATDLPAAVKAALGATRVDGRLDVAGGALVGRLRVSAAPPEAPLPAPDALPVYTGGPIRIAAAGAGGPCLRRATAGASAALRAVSAAPPDMRGVLLARGLTEIEADLACAEAEAALKPAAAAVRRMMLVPAALSELGGWAPSAAVARLEPLCEAGDAIVCGLLSGVGDRPEPALPAVRALDVPIDGCPAPLGAGVALRVTAGATWLGPASLPDGVDGRRRLSEAGDRIALGVDAELPWAAVAPVLKRLVDAGVERLTIVARRGEARVAVPLRLRPPPRSDDDPAIALRGSAQLARGTPVELTAAGARLDGAAVDLGGLRARTLDAVDPLFDLYPAADVPWRVVAEHAAAVCGGAVLAPEAPLPTARGGGALDPTALGGLDPVGARMLGRGGVSLGGDAAGPVGAAALRAADGSLSRDIIQRVLRRHRNHVRYCYEKALSRNPDLRGKLKAAFAIAPDGTVGGVTVEGDLDDDEVRRCVGRVVTRMRFPTSAKETRVSYPFVFAPQ